MEPLDDEELLIKRNAKKHFKTCLNLVDKDELLEAITAIEKAINLQPNNELFTEISQHLKDLQFSRMEDSYGRQECHQPSSKERHNNPSSIPGKTNFSFVNGSQKQRTCNGDNMNVSSRRGKCSQNSSNCEEKHNATGSDIPNKEKPEKLDSFFNDIDKEEGERNDSGDCEKPRWFPNPAKYNVEGFDIDARFLEEVCKQRESADGWDTYMKLLSDLSQEDDDTSDEIDDSDDLNVQNIGSINDHSGDNLHSSKPRYSPNLSDKTVHTKKVHEEKHTKLESNPSVGSSHKERNTCNMKKSSETSSSHPKMTPREPSEDGEKERLYFMNGTGIYGIPPSTSADSTSTTSTKTSTRNTPKKHPSENDFYDNLRFYFKVNDSKSEFMNRNKESTAREAASTKPHVSSDPKEKTSSTKNEEKNDIPSKETQTCGSSRRSTPVVSDEKHSDTCKSREVFNEHQGKDTEKAEMPKRPNISDKKGKKGNKNRVASEDSSSNRQTTTKTKLNKKHKTKVSESTKENKQTAGKEKTTRTTKEEKTKKKISNSSESSEMTGWNILQTVKKVAVALLWVVCYAVIILLIALIFAVKCLMSIIKFLIEIIMSWNMSIAVMNKLSLWTRMLFSKSRDLLVWLIGAYYSCKARCIRWYYGIRTLGVKEFFFGSGRPAQTYNLPNSGEDAIQQLLLKRNGDPYSILGVPNDASNDDIRKQYRKLAVLVHPDKNSHLHSAEAFRVLTSAYDIIGDPEKRLEFDREVARRESFQGSKSPDPTRDFSDPREVFAELLRQMEEIRESLSCDVCDSRHRRILTDRDPNFARFCSHCSRRHPAKEGDFWKESTYMGFGRSKFYACMEGRIYDISEWGLCQERNGFCLPSDTHRVLGRISTRPQHHTPPTSRFEEEIWREIFGQHDQYNGNYGNQGSRNRQQRSRRKKRR